MKIIFLVIISIIYFLSLLIFFMKKWYMILAIRHVYIPDFIYSRDEFISDQPLKILRIRRNKMIIFNILIIILMFMFFYGTYSFYITLLSFILSYIFCVFTFNRRIFENEIFSIFSDYLK